MTAKPPPLDPIPGMIGNGSGAGSASLPASSGFKGRFQLAGASESAY